MAWHLNLGIDKDVLRDTAPEQREPELFRFDMLGVMIILVAFIAFGASVVYLLLISHHWALSLGTGALIGLMVFNLYRLMLVTSINAYHTELGEFQSDHERLYRHVGPRQAAGLDEATIRELVGQQKTALRSLAMEDKGYRHDNAQMATFLIKLTILVLFALVFATGMELFVFRAQLNEAFAGIREVYAARPESWILRAALRPPDEGRFFLLDCHSILFAVDVLKLGLGPAKILIDLAVIAIFTIPLVLTYRSHELINSAYVREQALQELSISHYHYLKTQVLCRELGEEIAAEDLAGRVLRDKTTLRT